MTSRDARHVTSAGKTTHKTVQPCSVSASTSRMATWTESTASLSARVLFYPSLLWNLARNRLQDDWHWFDEITEACTAAENVAYASLLISIFSLCSTSSLERCPSSRCWWTLKNEWVSYMRGVHTLGSKCGEVGLCTDVRASRQL